MILYYFFGFIVGAVVLIYVLHRQPNEPFLDSIRTISATQVAAQNAILNNQQLADQKQKEKYIADYKQVVSAASSVEKQEASSVEKQEASSEPPESKPKAPTPAPTAYKDPKDMTAEELRRFKRMTIFDNFTVQDYKNWLMLYQKDYYLLNDENLLNLRNLLRGESLFLRDIPSGPTGGLPMDNTNNTHEMNNTQKYYARMYDQLARTEQILAPVHSAVGGGTGAGRARQEVGYNYNEYSEFAAPVAMPQLQVVNGQVEQQYRRPRRDSKNNNKKIITIPLEDVVAPYPVSPTM